MLCEVHVSRFVEWTPSSIAALAYSPLCGTLAVARRDGNVELWRQLGVAPFRWFSHSVFSQYFFLNSVRFFRSFLLFNSRERLLESTRLFLAHQKMVGSENSATRSVVWSGQRLFSSGLNGIVVEWDPRKLCAVNAANSNGGAVWDIAINPAHTILAAACNDGGVRLFNIADGCLEYMSELPRQKGAFYNVQNSSFSF